ncbi:MAG: hypothetical protein SGJ09_03090, partial [Phycisphaerae bacterium]|nr:hypothetical protein [Phycisphaerae bacterium]
CAIAHTKSIPDWATTMLTPLLADASAVGTNYGGPDGEIMRVKDLAAIIILKGVPETTFDPGAEASDRDDQIKAMRAALERVSRGEIITATKPESFGPLTQVTFMKPGAYVGLDPKSDREHVYGVTSNGCGDEAAPRLLEMDVATGTLRDRPIIVPEHEQVVLIHSSVGGVGAGVGPGNTTLLRSKTHIYTLDHATCTARSLAKLPETDESSA